MKIVLEPMENDSKLLKTRFVFTKQENRDFMARQYGTYKSFVKKEPATAPQIAAIRPVKPVHRNTVTKTSTDWSSVATVSGYGCMSAACFLFLVTGGFGFGHQFCLQAMAMIILGFSVGKMLTPILL